MDEHLFIVLYRARTGKWNPLAGGVVDTRSDAETLIRAEQIKGSTLEYAIVEGPVVSPETMEQAAARLGEF